MLTRIQLPRSYPVRILALGSQTRNTVCALRDQEACFSEEHADLDDAETFRRFTRTVETMAEELACGEYTVACDAHPTYASSRYARRIGRPLITVQHHFAHAVSAGVDAGFDFPMIGVVCDGNGFGADGHVWGGEVLYCDPPRFERLAHLCYLPLPGGDAAVREPWKIAFSLIAGANSSRNQGFVLPEVFRKVPASALKLVERQMRRGLNLPLSSSLGRLFDGVAFLLGTCSPTPPLGTAPVTLERAAGNITTTTLYPFEIHTTGKTHLLDWRPLVSEILKDCTSQYPVSEMAARFHATVAEMFARTALDAAHQYHTDRIVLSGGCFFNSRLKHEMVKRLTDSGIRIALPSRVSTGDAGLSLGQAVVAACQIGQGE